MQRTWFYGATLYNPEAPKPAPGNVLVNSSGRIEAVLPPQTPAPADAAPVDLTGLNLAPGFLDLHYHGRLIFARASDAAQELQRAATQMLRSGTTGFLPTTVAWPQAQLHNFVSAWAKACAGQESALGLHLEGPWLHSPAAGAQPSNAIRPYNAAEGAELWARGEGRIRMVTFAPEAGGAAELQRDLTRHNIVPALGHSHASAEQTLAAAANGAQHVTHLFNAMGAMHHRQPGLAGVALTDPRLSCDIICDGAHVHPAAVKLAARAKGAQLSLISDRIEAPQTGAADFGAGKVQNAAAANSPLRLQNGTLAGSALTLDAAVQNAVRFGALPLPQAIAAVTLRPARVLGIENTRGTLRRGARADFALFRGGGAAENAKAPLTVQQTWLAGRRAFARKS